METVTIKVQHKNKELERKVANTIAGIYEDGDFEIHYVVVEEETIVTITETSKAEF